MAVASSRTPTASTALFRADRWLYAFITMHLLLWTLIPALVRDNLPLDAMEGATWGHQLEWGYDKNPFLNGWLTALATQLGHYADWPVYLFSQLSVVICFWAVWKLAKHMLPPVYAFIAVVVLEGIQYYNVHAIDFNDNTLELGLWALTGYCFYQALRHSTYRNWILTGLFAGLGMMTKYYTAALLAGMALFLLTDSDNRKLLATRAPYAGLGVFILLLIPHFLWLRSHDYVTVMYMFERASNTPRWSNHYLYPLQFSALQLQALLPATLLYACLFLGKKNPSAINAGTVSLSPFNHAFLMWVAVAPFVMTVLLSIIAGITLRGGWGTPLLSWFGIVLVSLIQPSLTIRKMHRFLALVFTLMLASLAAYSYSLLDSDTPSSANYPGREIAQAVTQQWRAQTGKPLRYVAGPRWVSGNVGLYSPDHPAVYLEWSKRHAAWIDEEQLRRQGAVFVWEISDKERLPPAVQQHFAGLHSPVVLEFDWHRNRRHLAPIKIGMAILPPASVQQPTS